MEAPLEEIEFLARSQNRVAVLRLLATESHTRRSLAAATGASQATLGRIPEDFTDRSWVRRDEPLVGGGRRRRSDARESLGHVADGRRHDRQVAGERLLHCVGRPFVCRREQQRVGGVHVRRHSLVGHAGHDIECDLATDPVRHGADNALRSREVLDWPRRVVWVQHVQSAVVPPELASREPAIERSELLGVDAVRNDPAVASEVRGHPPGHHYDRVGDSGAAPTHRSERPVEVCPHSETTVGNPTAARAVGATTP